MLMLCNCTGSKTIDNISTNYNNIAITYLLTLVSINEQQGTVTARLYEPSNL